MTLEHLQALRNVIQSQPQVVELVDDAVARVHSTDGSIVVNPGGRLAFGVNPPGQVRYFAGGQHYRTEQLPVLDPSTVAHPWSGATTQDRCGQSGYLGLGLNMYDR